MQPSCYIIISLTKFYQIFGTEKIERENEAIEQLKGKKKNRSR